MLEIKNLVVNYGVITALQGVSLEVQQGDAFAPIFLRKRADSASTPAA